MFGKVNFTNPITPLWALEGKNEKCVFFLGQQSKQLILNNAFQNISCLQAMSIKKKACFGPLTLSLIS